MEELVRNSYTYELVDKNKAHVKYDFVSEVTVAVPKRVSFIPIHNFPTYFNLAFGDITVDDKGVEKIDDRARNINRTDGETILNTALLCSINFLTNHPGTTVIFFGNSAPKHRYYKQKICSGLNLTEKYLVVQGAVIPGYIETYTDQGFKGEDDLKPIIVDEIVFEPFTPARTPNYNFLTFNLAPEDSV